MHLKLRMDNIIIEITPHLSDPFTEVRIGKTNLIVSQHEIAQLIDGLEMALRQITHQQDIESASEYVAEKES